MRLTKDGNLIPVVIIYRYGRIAWVWRGFAAAGITASIALLMFWVRFADWTFLAMSVPLGLPSTLLPWMMAVSVKTGRRDEIVVTNLFFVRRRIAVSALGRPRVRLMAQATFRMIPAPRAWVPVRGGLPIYIDLLGDITDRGAFQAVFKVPRWK